MKLRAGNYLLDLSCPVVMGILNVTPDSFSDGGRFLNIKDALWHASAMIDAGAAIIDVGGESTRPGADDTSIQQELDRVIPVVEALGARFEIPLSIDTSKPEIMLAATSAGASMINDIYALRREGAIEAALAAEVPVCLMHMQGTPYSMQDAPQYEDLPGEIIRFLADRLDAAVAAGLERDALLIDPGFGFGKADHHNLEILAKLAQFAELGRPLLVGLSRKRMLGYVTGKSIHQREAAGIAAAVIAVEKGARIIRTHDVAGTVDALKVQRAVERFG